MKSWLLTLIASKSIKNAIAYAYKVCVLTAEALRGVQTSDQLSEEHRELLGAVLRGVLSLQDFLARLVVIFGVVLDSDGHATLATLGMKLDDATDQLNRLTGEL